MEKLSYKLESFEGPLDLLLTLIQKNKLSICEVRIADLVDQYLAYLEQMRTFDPEIASEFLEMAARLIHMKTVSLLPKHEEAETLRQELIGELLEYEQCRKAAAMLGERTGGLDRFVRRPARVDPDRSYRLTHRPEVLLQAYLSATGRGRRRLPPPITSFTQIVARKIVSVSSKILFLLRRMRKNPRTNFRELFASSASRSDAVALFLAVLELIRADRIRAVGNEEDPEIVFAADERAGQAGS